MKQLLSLGPLGQIPSISTYTIITLGFSLETEEHKHEVLTMFENAANDIVTSFPWLAGQVVIEKPSDDLTTSTGSFKIVEYSPHQGRSKFIRSKDCEDMCPDLGDLLRSRAPTSMLDGSIIAPAYGFANSYPEDVTKPVVIMQANFVRGGLLLVVCTNHCVMDANGNEQFIRHFADLCRGAKISDDKIQIGNADRDSIIPPMDQKESTYSFYEYRCASSLGAAPGEWPPRPSEGLWKTFRFTQASIAALKRQASRLCSSSSEIQYISSDDAVSTFIWSRIAVVRSAWLPQACATQIIRAVNGRKRLETPINEGFMGHVILCCYTTLPLKEVVCNNLSATTMEVRRSLLGIDDKQVRSFFHLLKTEKDKSTINYGAKMNTDADIMITSFVGQRLYDTSFGKIGKPEFIRRPKLPDCPGLFYMMPRTRDGDVDLIACLPQKEFQGLQNDKEWTEFVEFLG